MKTLILKSKIKKLTEPDSEEEIQYDVVKIVKTCNRRGYTIENDVAEAAWNAHSEKHGQSWLLVPRNPELTFQIILLYVDVKE